MKLEETLSRAKNLSIWLHEQINDGDLDNTDLRHRMGFALFQHALDVDDGIIFLLEGNLPGAAMALARPRFEGYVRGLWLLHVATDDSVKGFQRGKHYLIGELVNDISNSSYAGRAWVSSNYIANRNDFNDLTHGGMNHIIRRVRQAVIEPHYPGVELISLIDFGMEVKIRIGFEILAWMRSESGLNKLQQIANTIRN